MGRGRYVASIHLFYFSIGASFAFRHLLLFLQLFLRTNLLVDVARRKDSMTVDSMRVHHFFKGLEGFNIYLLGSLLKWISLAHVVCFISSSVLPWVLTDRDILSDML